jgi:hypothetical protein
MKGYEAPFEDWLWAIDLPPKPAQNDIFCVLNLFNRVATLQHIREPCTAEHQYFICLDGDV